MAFSMNEDTDQVGDEAERSRKMSSTVNTDQTQFGLAGVGYQVKYFLQTKKQSKEIGLP